MNEAETRAKVIDPALHGRGWNEDLIRREVTAGRIYVHGTEARQARRGRVDYVLRVKAAGGPQAVTYAEQNKWGKPSGPSAFLTGLPVEHHERAEA